MREETTTRTLYQFKELTETAQATAIEAYQQQAGEFFDSAEFVYDDAADTADLFGLDIRQRRKTSKDGSKTWYDPAIYYSGFWSQGDGACFEGRYEYKRGALAAVKADRPTDTELHRIVEELQHAQAANFYKIIATTEHNGRYYHSGCMSVALEHADDSYRDIKNEDDFIQALRDFADWIYKRLEESYEYDTSEENARQYLEDSDYEFTADGETC